MLEVMGRGYVIDHVIASLRKQRKELTYRIYVTESLRIIAENTAKFVGGRMLTQSFVDIIEPKEKPKMTTEGVVSKMRKKIGGGRA